MGTDNQCKDPMNNYIDCRVGQLTTSIVLLRCFQESVFWTYQMEFLEDISLKTASLKGSQIISKHNTKAIQSIPYQIDAVWAPYTETHFIIIIGLTEYFLVPYYRCRFEMTGTSVNPLLNCTEYNIVVGVQTTP